ncbi:MAG: hypothetical protein NT023_21060 [Armatimonadetes bacterium]|nr:hypothetical protein [Armatimonadota bacterium]
MIASLSPGVRVLSAPARFFVVNSGNDYRQHIRNATLPTSTEDVAARRRDYRLSGAEYACF